MDSHTKISEKLFSLIARFQKFIRTLPDGHQLRHLFLDRDKNFDLNHYPDDQVPSNPTEFLNEIRCQFDEINTLFNRIGRPDDFLDLLDSLNFLIEQLSIQRDSILIRVSTENGKLLSQTENLLNAIVKFKESSSFDLREKCCNRESSGSAQQSTEDTLPRKDICIDLTIEDNPSNKDGEIIAILDSSDDENVPGSSTPTHLKTNRARVCRTSAQNSLMDAKRAIRESIQLLSTRCQKFILTVPVGTLLSSLAWRELVPNMHDHVDVQVPSNPAEFLKDICNRFDEVYELFDRMGQPDEFSEYFESLKCFIKELSINCNCTLKQGSTITWQRHSSKRKQLSVFTTSKQDYVSGKKSSDDDSKADVEAREATLPKVELIDLTTEDRVVTKDHEVIEITDFSEDESDNTQHAQKKLKTGQSQVASNTSLLQHQEPTQKQQQSASNVVEPLGTTQEMIQGYQQLVAMSQENSVLMLPMDRGYEKENLAASPVPTILQNLTPSCLYDIHGPSLKPRASGYAEESHRQPIYCISWSKDFSRSSTESEEGSVSRYLSTCGSRYISIYRVVFTSTHPRAVNSKHFSMTQSHIADDEQESFYACTFAGRSHGESKLSIGPCSKEMPELLCVGGKMRVIHVIDVFAKKTVMTLQGHGESILSLKPCPTDEWILMSSSEDESVRLWNLRSGAPIAVLKGREGHMDSIITTGWNPEGSLITSGGMDTTIKIWDARDDSEIKKAIVRSHRLAELIKKDKCVIHEKPLLVREPIFSTSKIHAHCVDCVQFIHNGLILSKSVDSCIEIWEPIIEGGTDGDSLRMKNQSRVNHYFKFVYKNGDAWFMNFATDPLFKWLAVGDCNGYVYLWHIGQKSSNAAHILSTHGKTNIPVRGVAFSPCGNTLVAYRDDGSLMKWDL